MKLYLVHVGFYDNSLGMYEQHTNILVVAADAKAAKEQIKQKELFINKKMHIDGIQEIQTIDGYDIKLEKSNQISDKIVTLNYDAAKALN